MHCNVDQKVKRLWMTLFTLAVLFQLIKSDPPTKVCPIYCHCNWKNNLNHADCSGKRLISPYFDVPYEVQSLDLSYNDLSLLDNDCFKGYIYLINITISNNAIHIINLDTFVPLRRVNAIDLSYNRLESIDSGLFESNRQLRTLNLEGNKFITLNNGPFIKSKYLRTFNLAHAQINVLLPEHYTELPQLQNLDISHNLIITVDKFLENMPKHLQTLNLVGNNLNCDKSLQDCIEQLEKRYIEILYNDCQAVNADLKSLSAGVVEKYERLQLMDDRKNEEEEEMIKSAGKDVGNSQENFNDTMRSGVLSDWHLPIPLDDYDNYYTNLDVDQNENNEEDQMQHKTKSLNETCQHWCHTLFPKHALNDAVNFNRKQYTDFDLLFVFLCGSAVGVALTIFIGSCIICIWRCFTLKETRMQIEDPYDSQYAVVTQRLAPLPRSTVDAIRTPSVRNNDESANDRIPIVAPQPPRRRRRRATTTQLASTRRDNQLILRSSGDNFISRLFGRPARHQYYRTLNENTATLIRRLSRSNLFANRLGQNFGDRDHFGEPNTPNTNARSDDVSMPNMENELEDTTIASRIPHRRRPETPPPLYSEIVSKEGDENS